MKFQVIGFPRAPKLKPWEMDKVYETYGKICYICERKLNKHNRSIDHVFPRSLHGTNDLENLRPCCITCNKEKSNRTIYDFQKTLVDKAIHSYHRRVGIPDGLLVDRLTNEKSGV